tara:strand:+ start:236 stop:790 length:555 start_codon:yes stop_codon:yes gene_type:complete
MTRKFIKDYIVEYKNTLDKDVSNEILKLQDLVNETKSLNSKVIIAGNGGSASIASHISIDLTKQAKIRTVNFNEANLITCFSNDFGYENWLVKSIEYYSDRNDLIILISSSGKSSNMVNAAKFIKMKKMKLITFTGFDIDNPLKKLGDLNFWVNSKSYNIIENTHQIWLTILCDSIVGKREYPA